jgi:hypothetical protein
MMLAILASLLARQGGTSPALLLLGPGAGGVMYFMLWRHYRNTDKSHGFEHETRVAAQPATGNDRKVDEVKGTRSMTIKGNNRDDHRQRVQRIP